MSNLKSLSARILALALYCRDSGQVPFSVCRVGSFSSAGVKSYFIGQNVWPMSETLKLVCNEKM